MRPLGLWDSFTRMPRRVQEVFWQRKLPDPAVEFEQSVPTEGKYRAMRRALESVFRVATVEVNGTPMAVRDFLTVVTACMLVVRHTRLAGMPDEVVRFLREAGPCLERCHADHMPAAMLALFRSIQGPLLAHSRLDTRLLTSRMDCGQNAAGKIVVRVIVSAVKPQARNVRLDGAARPMYHVASPASANEIKWLSWDDAQLGQAGSGKEYPVCVQSHALRQLHARVNLPAAAPYLEAWLAESLAEPLIVKKHGSNLLVEYRIGDHRIGYLVVTPLADVVAVRTFLFLTMQGTPEARLLHKQLRLRRQDVEWLGLCDLAAFTQTDLKADLVLRPLMEACGCGHLFDLAETDYTPQPRALAAEVRRFLRLAA